MRGIFHLLGGLLFLGGLGISLWALPQAFRTTPIGQARCQEGTLTSRAELWSSGAVEFPLCRAATVELLLEGTLARGEGPYALVVEGTRVLWQGEVRGVVRVRIRTTGKALLALAFTNDFYEPPEDRNLFLRGLRVEP